MCGNFRAKITTTHAIYVYMSEVLCIMHHLTICILANKMHRILVIRLYFPLDALHVSDYISPSSGATFYKLYIAFGIYRYMRTRLAVVWLRMVPAYTKCDVQLIKVAPDDELI